MQGAGDPWLCRGTHPASRGTLESCEGQIGRHHRRVVGRHPRTVVGRHPRTEVVRPDRSRAAPLTVGTRAWWWGPARATDASLGLIALALRPWRGGPALGGWFHDRRARPQRALRGVLSRGVHAVKAKTSAVHVQPHLGSATPATPVFPPRRPSPPSLSRSTPPPPRTAAAESHPPSRGALPRRSAPSL